MISLITVPMSCMPDMTPTSLTATVAPRTGKMRVTFDIK